MRYGPQTMIFDLDGVITFTARVHAAAWKDLFDKYLRDRSQRLGEAFRPFDAERDYLTYVDGKPRYEGVASFLASRAITIPYGGPSDSPDAETVCGLGNRKDLLFTEKLREVGVDVDWEAVRLVRELRDLRVRVGLASSSRNAIPVLEQAGIRDLFDKIVDGIVSERLCLRGKPEPDIFLRCLADLDASADPARSGIVEDSISGVQAGHRGGIGLVLGVDRRNTGELARNGANWVIHDFANITADQIVRFFADPVRAA
jgi:HAD superfamily hydrolase (TIGR01509 family)